MFGLRKCIVYIVYIFFKDCFLCGIDVTLSGPGGGKEGRSQGTEFLHVRFPKPSSLQQNNLSDCPTLQPSQTRDILPELVSPHGANLTPGVANMTAGVTAWLQIRLAASLEIPRPADYTAVKTHFYFSSLLFKLKGHVFKQTICYSPHSSTIIQLHYYPCYPKWGASFPGPAGALPWG